MAIHISAFLALDMLLLILGMHWLKERLIQKEIFSGPCSEETDFLLIGSILNRDLEPKLMGFDLWFSRALTVMMYTFIVSVVVILVAALLGVDL